MSSTDEHPKWPNRRTWTAVVCLIVLWIHALRPVFASRYAIFPADAIDLLAFGGAVAFAAGALITREPLRVLAIVTLPLAVLALFPAWRMLYCHWPF